MQFKYPVRFVHVVAAMLILILTAMSMQGWSQSTRGNVRIDNFTDQNLEPTTIKLIGEILGCPSSLYILFAPIPEEFRRHHPDIYAFIDSHTEGSMFVIRISRFLRKSDYHRILAHEIGHIKQIMEGRLVMLNSNQVVWEGDTIQLEKTVNRKRGFEVEARKISRALKSY